MTEIDKRKSYSYSAVVPGFFSHRMNVALHGLAKNEPVSKTNVVNKVTLAPTRHKKSWLAN